jgi:hypothetical protein
MLPGHFAKFPLVPSGDGFFSFRDVNIETIRSSFTLHARQRRELLFAGSFGYPSQLVMLKRDKDPLPIDCKDRGGRSMSTRKVQQSGSSGR